MREGREAGIVEWIGMFISILAMLLLSLRKKKATDMDSETVDQDRPPTHPREESPIDDEEPEREPMPREPMHTPRPLPQAARYGRDAGRSKAMKHSAAMKAYAKRADERALNANYRLKNALEGFQQRRPIDQKKLQTAIEQRTLGTMAVSEFLRVDAVADAQKAKQKEEQTQARLAEARLRNGLIWKEFLQPPLALRKESHLL